MNDTNDGATSHAKAHGHARLAGLGLALCLAGCGSSAASGQKGDGGAAAVPLTAADLKGCQSGDLTPCSSFTTPTGTTVQLGPYGAVMEANVGKGFENAVQSGDAAGNTSTCQLFASIFMEDPKLTTQLLNTSQNGMSLDFALYTVYRPALWKTGEKYPVITWGNGTCAQPEGYGALLRYVASYGYVVVAANSRWVGSGSPQPMLHALDFAEAANKDPASPYYGRLDLTKVGAMGHSQGGGATVKAASDARIQDVIVFNSAFSGVAKPYLAVSGDMDLTNFTAAGMASTVAASSEPGAYLYYHNPAGMGPYRGHLVLMLSPDRVTGPTVAWWQMMLRGDATARASFVGASCTLCSHATDYEYGEQGLN